jgi:alkylation response protein AidB-like acyl-CoA dehydrogenase
MATRYLDAARALAPMIAAAGDRIEREQALPSELVAALADAGLFRLLVPRSIGGAELALPDYLEIVEAVSLADGSTAWCLNQTNGRATLSAWLEPTVARELFGDDRTATIANGPLPGRAVPVEGGFELTGEWTLASGCHHATWLAALAVVVDPAAAASEQARRRADGSRDVRHFVVPTREARIIPHWDAAGLRGTGSDSFALDHVFVPAGRSAAAGHDRPREPGPLYLFPTNLIFAVGFAAVTLGIARAALDALRELAGAKTPRGTTGRLRDLALTQMQVGQAEAHLRAGRAFLLESVRDVWSVVLARGTLDLDQRVLLRLAGTHAMHLAAQVTDLAYSAAGASAIEQANPIQRRYQDIHVATQHVQARLAHYESAGRYHLGLDPDFQWL